MRILVTGSAGMSGSKICELLVYKGHTVVGIDNYFNGRYENMSRYYKNPRFKFYELDIRNTSGIQELMEAYKFDMVFHMAAVVETKHFYNSVELVYDVNVVASHTLCKMAKATGVRSFINASTSEAYGHSAEEIVCEESPSRFDSSEVSTRWSYAHGKILGEHLTKSLEDENFKVISLRYANVYGSADSPESKHIIPYLVRCVKSGIVPDVGHRYATIRRTFLHNNDSASATIYLAMKLHERSLVGHLFNIATSEEYTIQQLVDKVHAVLGASEVHVKIVDLKRPDEPVRRVLDCSKLLSLGWTPSMSLEDGIKETAGILPF